MKHFTSALISCVTLCISAAAADMSKDVDALTLDFERAKAAALEPVLRRYIMAYEALQRKATQANDLETALRVKKIIEDLGDLSASGSGRADIIGNWVFEHKSIAAPKVNLTFKVDGSVLSGTEKIGLWEIKGRNMIITYTNNPGISDRYDLPIRAGKLAGVNSSNQQVSLTKRGAQ